MTFAKLAHAIQYTGHHPVYGPRVREGIIETREVPTFWAVRKICRAYGGPEEGGWWYDQSVEYLGAKRCMTVTEQVAHATKLVEDFELRQSLPGRWTSRNGGEDYELVDMTALPKDTFNHKPQWE